MRGYSPQQQALHLNYSENFLNLTVDGPLEPEISSLFFNTLGPLQPFLANLTVRQISYVAQSSEEEQSVELILIHS